MKKIVRISGRWALAIAFFLTVDASSAQGPVSFQVFYDQLAPYGSWVNYNQYGYVWIPTSVRAGFRPYGSAGHWVYTADGWTWISDYDWGWAPFHYGNWFYDDSYGWMWRPGYDWAPAWVTWGEYGGNYGWAPVGPDIQIGVAWSSYRPPAYYWTFVPRAYIMRPNMNNYYVHYNTSVTIVRNITVINNINTGAGRPAYMRGPQARYVEKYTHAPVRPVAVRESARPGRFQVQQGQLSVYRPAINRGASARPAAPTRVQSLQAVKPTGLPGYNRHVQPINKPAAGSANRPVSPVNSNRPAPANTSRPAAGNNPRAGGRTRENAPKPNPVIQPARPAPNSPAPANNRPPANPPAARPSPQIPPHQPSGTSHRENRPPAAGQHQPVRPLPNAAAPRNIPRTTDQSRPAEPSRQPRQQPAQQARQQPIPQPRQQPRQQPVPQPRQQPAPQPRPPVAPEGARPADRNPR